MKIAVFTDAFSPQVNGVVTHILSTLPLLARKHEIFVFAPNLSSPTPKELRNKNITVKVYKGIPFPVYEKIMLTSPYHPSLFSVLKSFRPDIIHVHTPFTMGANGVIAAKKFNIPLVETFHTYVTEPEYLRLFKLNKIGMDKSAFVQEGIWSILALFYEPADSLICPSEAARKDVFAHYPHKKVHVISNGINLASYKKTPPSEEDVQRKYNIPGPYLLYVGRISVEKNIDDLIAAYSLSRLSEKGISLVIAGDGPLLKKLVKNMRKDQQKNIIFLGELSHKEVVSSGILHHAYAFVSASTSETQGISFLEAMAAGLPLIVVESKTAVEVLDNNGFLCKHKSPKDLARAMQQIVENKKLRKKFAVQSHKNVKKHDIFTTIKRLEEVYQEAISLHEQTAPYTGFRFP